MTKKTTEQFITDAIAVHGNFYDYSKTNYKNNKSKVIITCPIHGDFEQIPNDHLNGSGCPKCANDIKGKRKRKTTAQFITDAKAVHGDFYDYSLVNYKNNKEKVKIICSMHGVFEQMPNDHLGGSGCPKCIGRNKTTSQFITDAIAVHGNFYDYSKTEYVNCSKKVKITCPIHGDFEIIPRKHLENQGCKKCGNGTWSKEQFIQEASKIHNNKYDYSKIIFNGNKSKIEIICPTHGSFWQRVDHHIKDFSGCPKCKGSGPEQIIISWLDKNNIEYIYQKKFNDLKFKNFLWYDFFIPKLNLLIEYQGEQHYKPMRFADANIKATRHRDWLKRKYARDNGYELLTISFKENKILNKILEEKILCRY